MNNRRIIVCIVAAVILIGAIFGGVKYHEYIKEKRYAEAWAKYEEERRKLEIMQGYSAYFSAIN